MEHFKLICGLDHTWFKCWFKKEKKNKTKKNPTDGNSVLCMASKFIAFSFSSEHPLLRSEEQEAGSHTDPLLVSGEHRWSHSLTP